MECLYCKNADSDVKKIDFAIMVGGVFQQKGSVVAHVKCFDDIQNNGLKVIRDIGMSANVTKVVKQ